jgi:hypothetical protein
MGEGSSGPGPGLPASSDDDKPTRVYSSPDQVTWPRTTGQANPPTEVAAPHPPTEVAAPHPPTEVSSAGRPTVVVPPSWPTEPAAPHPPTEVAAPHPPTEVAAAHPPTQAAAPYLPTQAATSGPAEAVASSPAADVVRYGPGVPAAPASQAAVTAERVWRTGRLPDPPRHRARLRRLLGSALTVILLAAAGVVLFLRFHHAPFQVSGVAITQQTKTTCGVDVTGRITTNGSAGTVSYQWVFRPQVQPPQPLNQSVVAGQHDVYVTVAVQGQGHGSASQTVTLQVLGPDPKNASAHVVVSC